jgi:hypothetical protein
MTPPIYFSLPSLAAVFCCWLGWQMLRQNGRILLRLEALERHLAEWELAGDVGRNGKSRRRLNRDGLKAGTPAPDFLLPRLDGGELSLEQLRRRRVLLVFSDPECGPCNQLAPRLEEFHRASWEISRLYRMFATPIAYLIDERGVMVNDVAVGVEPILALLANATNHAAEMEFAAA